MRRLRGICIVAAAAMLQLASIPALGLTLVDEARLIDDEPQRRNYFGRSPSIDGDTAVIGTLLFRPDQSSTGGVVVFTRSGAAWQYRTRLIPANAPDGDYKLIGVRADVAGDVLVFSVSNADQPEAGGHVYVYTGSGSSWTREAELVAGPDEWLFGQQVATDGQTILVDSDPGTLVYVRDASGWSRQAMLPNGHHGQVIGDTAVLAEEGAVAVYTRVGGSWSRAATLPVGDISFTRSLAFDGDTIMVSGRTVGPNYRAFAFHRTGSGWQGPTELHPSGRVASLALSDDYAIVIGHDPDHSHQIVNVFERRSGAWILDRTFPSPTRFGSEPALDGDTVILGVPADTDENGSWFFGAAYVYRIRAGLGEGLNLHCTADVDRDGRNDAAVVTSQREVSVRRLGGNPVSEFLLDSFGHLKDTALLPDTDTNGAAELVSVVQGPRSLSGSLPATGEVRDLLSSTTLAAFTIGSSVSAPHVAVLPDLTGNGMSELAVVGPGTAGVYDSLTGQRVSRIDFSDYIEPRGLGVFPDRNGNGRPELAVLGDNLQEERTDKIEMRDPETGNATAQFWLGAGWTPVAQALVADTNGNGAADVAVLRTNAAGQVNVQIRDLQTRRPIRSVDFPTTHTADHLAVVPDVNGNGIPELAVFGRRHDGANQRAMIRDARTGQWLRDLWFDRNFPGRDFVSCGDLNGNGADDVALLGYDPVNGRNKVTVKDTATGARVAMVRFW